MKDLLCAAMKLSMTEEILRSTRIGIVVNKLKKLENQDVVELSKKVVNKWKEDVSKPAQSDAPAPAVSSSSKGASTTNQAPSKEAIKERMLKHYDVSARRKVQEITDPTHTYSSMIFFQVAELFYDYLNVNNDSDDEQRLIELMWSMACKIEDAINQVTPQSRDSKGYSSKARTLSANLKRNDVLRQNLLNGSLLPGKFVNMTVEELATAEQQRELQKALTDDLLSRRTDYYDENRDKILLANGIDPNAGGEFTCRKCKGNKTKHSMAQTRSSDEPMTVFITCLTCGNRWKQ